jgi:PAS domain S-box-containing protein
MSAPIPDNEVGRLAALRGYEILDTLPEEAFDRITRIAAAYLNVPVALVSLVDETRQWFKSRHGLDAEETPRDVAFCAHAIMNDKILVVGNATKDARFADNPLVTSMPNIRFYAGAPLHTKDGFNLGTLCAIGYAPRKITKAQKQILMDLAQIVIDEMELRLAVRKIVDDQAQALSLSAAQLKAIIESSPGAVVIRDLKGRNLMVNKIFSEWYATDRDEIIGKTMFDYLPPKISDEIAAQEREVVETQKNVEAERRVTFPDGVTRDVFSQKFPIFSFDGDCIAVGTIVNDITHIKKIETALRESENLLKSIFENVPVGLLIKGPDHVVERANPTYQNWYGLQAEKMVGRRSDQVEDFQSTEDAEFMNAQEREVLTTGRTQTRQVDRPFPNGQIHTVNITKFPVYDEQGNITRVGSVSVDVTDLKKGEQELQDAQEKLENIISNLPGGIFRRVLHTDGTESLDYNMGKIPRALGVETKIGVSSSEFVSKFILPEYREIRDEAVQRSAATMEPCIFEYPIRMPDDSIRWIQSVSVPHRQENGDIVWSGLNLDITDRVQADEERRRAQGQAEQANQAKSDFLAAMSHDLRTPLNAILGYAHLLSEQYLGPLGNKKYKECAENIRTSGEHLLMLVNDILDLSTIESGKQPLTKEKLFVEKVITECVETVAEGVQFNDIDLVTTVAENLPSIYADRRAIKQILLNLLSNSLKFTPKGGKITVSAKASKQNTTLSVTDTGKGIAAEKLPRLTEPFTKDERNPYLSDDGWGLGLAIVKSLVNLHDGTLDIKSKVGKGTTVTVTLPNGAP